MKKYFLALLIGARCNGVKAQTYFVSSNTHCLIDSYRDLVTQTNTKSCTYDNTSNPNNPKVKGSYYCIFSAMPTKGYNAGMAGFISFSSWYWFVSPTAKAMPPLTQCSF